MNSLMSSVMPQNSIVNARVKERNQESIVVQNKQVSLQAKKATSCLVEPNIGDKVLLCIDGEDVYIIAILEQATDAPLEIVTEQSLSIQSSSGDITLNAQESLNAFAQNATMVIPKVSLLAKVVTLKSKALNTIATSYQGFIERVTSRHKTLITSVESHEEHQSGSSRRVVNGSDIHQVQESITTAEGQVKIDAAQINIA
ncbi:MAG: DUF3540 domain-containing protein [Campylobacterota bacterium]|nr:DUF3540 domain-containing protein [Campylobacterota bacterium]